MAIKTVLSERERQANYRNRLYEAGFKQMRIWVPRDSEGKDVKLERKLFLKHLEALTAGWSKAKLSKLFSRTLKNVKEFITEEEKKKKG